MSRLRAALWGVCAFAIVYLLVGALRLPTLAYDPVARTVRFTAEVGAVSMRYYGHLVLACAAGICAAAPTLFSSGPPRPVAALTAAALSLVVLDLAWYLSPLLAPV
jgi:hypothetical protein